VVDFDFKCFTLVKQLALKIRKDSGSKIIEIGR